MYNSDKDIKRYQDKGIKRFNQYIKDNYKEIDSIKELTDDWYIITFKNKSVFKFKFFLPKEITPVFRIGDYWKETKIKMLF